MQVAQRGTSVTGITAAGYNTADRWALVLDTLGTWTQTVENDAPTGSGFRKSVKMLCTTADSTPAAADNLQFSTRLEGQNLQSIRKGTSDAKQLTLQFWVKSNVTGTYIVQVQDADNLRSISTTYTISSSGTWEKKTIIIPADTTGVFDNDNNVSLRTNFWLGGGTDFTSGTLNTSWNSIVIANIAAGQTNLAAATNNYWQITGVQLEVGAVATPFEFKPFGQDLRECQRYYQTFGDFYPGISNAANTTLWRQIFTFAATMRAAPTISITGSITSGFTAATIVSNLTSATLEISASARLDFRPLIGGVVASVEL
jgi:hypothetical protein